jgi:hypothetical protein
MKEEQMPTFLEVSDTDKANKVDLTVYRLERFSDTKNAWIFAKRRTKLSLPVDERANFLEIEKQDEANKVDMTVYRFECLSETRGTYMFVKRRIV